MTADKPEPIPPFERRTYETLADLQLELGLQKAQRIDLVDELNACVAHLMPVGGWPGDNAAQRKAAEVKACRADDEWKYINDRLRKCDTSIMLLKHRILANEELKQADIGQLRREQIIEQRRKREDDQNPW